MPDTTGSTLGPFWLILEGSCPVHKSICSVSAASHGHPGHPGRLEVVLDAYTQAHKSLPHYVLDHTGWILGSHLICILQTPGNKCGVLLPQQFQILCILGAVSSRKPGSQPPWPHKTNPQDTFMKARTAFSITSLALLNRVQVFRPFFGSFQFPVPFSNPLISCFSC